MQPLSSPTLPPAPELYATRAITTGSIYYADSIEYEHKKYIGRGAYGRVFSADQVVMQTSRKSVAVKLTLTSRNTMISCVRELDIMRELGTHPCITPCIDIVRDYHAVNQLPADSDKTLEFDTIGIVMPLMQSNLWQYVNSPGYNLTEIKTIMCQLLLGVEYMHQRGIMHRDLSASNILISRDNSQCIQAKITDFDRSKRIIPNEPNNHVVTNIMYRAPESFMTLKYNQMVDIWALGAIFYLLVTKKPFVNTDNPSEPSPIMLSKICKSLAHRPTKEALDAYRKMAINPNELPISIPRPRNKEYSNYYHAIVTDHNWTFVNVVLFNQESTTAGTFCQVCKLLDRMLRFDPAERFTATQCLDMPFFNGYRDYIAYIRKTYLTPSIQIPLSGPIPYTEKVTIVDCMERYWAAALVTVLYNNRSKIDWLISPQILFHALSLFDRYLARTVIRRLCSGNAHKYRGRLTLNIALNVAHTFHGESALFDVNTVAYRFFTCIYIAYKYFVATLNTQSWDKIFPRQFHTVQMYGYIRSFEDDLLEKFNHTPFHYTLYEVCALYRGGTAPDFAITHKALGVLLHQKAYDGDLLGLFKLIK